MGHVARKRFGQHFLADDGVIDGIVRAINPKPGEALIEIGPGLGALTGPLKERCEASLGVSSPSTYHILRNRQTAYEISTFRLPTR